MSKIISCFIPYAEARYHLTQEMLGARMFNRLDFSSAFRKVLRGSLGFSFFLKGSLCSLLAFLYP